jgi:uncharacterized repeat protein (TIGR01451 family)
MGSIGNCCCDVDCEITADDFNRADANPPTGDWHVVGGEWEIDNNQLEMITEGPILTTIRQPRLTRPSNTDFTIKMFFRWVGIEEDETCKVICGYISTTEYYYIEFYELDGSVYPKFYHYLSGTPILLMDITTHPAGVGWPVEVGDFIDLKICWSKVDWTADQATDSESSTGSERQSESAWTYSESNTTYRPSFGSLSLNRFTPSVFVPQNLEIPLSNLSITRFSPEVNVAPDGAIVPFPPTYVTLQTFEPLIITPEVLTPGTQSISIVTFVPSIASPIMVTPSIVAVSVSTFAPTPITPQTLTPATRALTLTTFDALLATPLVATPATLNNSLSSFAPTITTPQTLTPPFSTLVISTFAPSLATPLVVTPGTDSKTTTGFAPHVSTPQTLTPTTQSLAIATFAPTLNVPQTVTPDVTGLTLATFGPTIINPVETTPATATLVVSAFAPTAATPVVVTPPPLALVIDTETTCELILTTYPPEVIVDSEPCVPTVSITKSVSPNPITLGNVASWTITITNTSSCEVPSGIEVSDQLPDEADILYETGSQYGGSSNDSTSAPILTWVLPAIPVGQSVVLGYDTDTLSTGTFTNLATIDAGTGIGQSDTESLTVN